MGGSVALVHVKIDHRDLRRGARSAGAGLALRPFGLNHPCHHRNVVEHAKAAALVGVGVVRAAGQVGGDTFFARHAGGGNACAHRPFGALGHCRAPGKPNLPNHGGFGGSLRNRRDVILGVGQGQLGVRRRQRFAQVDIGQLLGELVAQHAVLGHGETVALWQGQNKLVGIERFHARIVANRRLKRALRGLPGACFGAGSKK